MHPIARLKRRFAEATASPDQIVWREQAPGLVVLGNPTRDQLASHGSGVEAVPGETIRARDAAGNFTDLRHAMHGNARRTAPDVFHRDATELRKRALNVTGDAMDIALGIGLPHPLSAAPKKTIAVDDAVMTVGGIAV